jgi:alkylation response protein AidB-like acyl-CoA dehydrogenase
MAKAFATETAVKVSSDAIQILGAQGYMMDHPLSATTATRASDDRGGHQPDPALISRPADRNLSTPDAR